MGLFAKKSCFGRYYDVYFVFWGQLFFVHHTGSHFLSIVGMRNSQENEKNKIRLKSFGVYVELGANPLRLLKVVQIVLASGPTTLYQPTGHLPALLGATVNNF